MSGFLFPNEAHLEWDLLIVIYPYITGLVAGAFIVSSLYHVFGLTRLKPVARFSLLVALAFLLVAPLPLVIHLGRPERALEMFFRPNFISAMSGFGYIWLFYLTIVLAEVWLVFRPEIVSRAASSKGGLQRSFYSALSFGVKNLSQAALAGDAKLVKLLALLGIPSAFLLHGYVGFIFGAVKANPWWSTPLMPIIFLMSAIVSGMALLLVLYVVITRLRKAKLDTGCVHAMGLWLGGFLTVALALEGLEVLTLVYESEESWEIIAQLIMGPLAVSYFGIQFFLGAIIPLLVLGSTYVFINMDSRAKTALRFTSALMVLVGVFAMRWNVVIGGQLISKSLRGLNEYIPPLLGEEGILVAAAFMVLPFVLLTFMSRMVSPWPAEAGHAVEIHPRTSWFPESPAKEAADKTDHATGDETHPRVSWFPESRTEKAPE